MRFSSIFHKLSSKSFLPAKYYSKHPAYADLNGASCLAKVRVKDMSALR